MGRDFRVYKPPVMSRLLLVALGGALGSMARYGVGLAAGRMFPAGTWPLGTLGVNVVGGLAMGLLVGWLGLRGGAGQETLRLFAAVGLLGGFTTFSAFSLETVLMIERREYGVAAAYVGLSVVLAIAALMAGLMIARRAFGAPL
jgi:CrcB protein